MKKVLAIIILNILIISFCTNIYAKYVVQEEFCIANLDIDRTRPKIEVVNISNTNTEYPEYASGKIFDGLASRYGDGFYETQTWFGDWENNDASGPFFTRGAYWKHTSSAGVFGFGDVSGGSYYGGVRFPYRVGGAVALRTFLVT